MKHRLCLKMLLNITLSVMLLLSSSALAQGTSAVPNTAEAWDEATAVRITFDGASVDIQGDGAALSDSILTISKAGTYVFSGAWENGQVCIDASKKDTVRLIFNGVSIRCQDSAPLYAPQAGKVILTLVRDTRNELSDSDSDAYSQKAPDAALYVQDSLVINGQGSLSITAHYKHGIVSKDDLLIEGGILSVTAADVGIRGRDTLTISGGEITVNAQGDALQSNNSDDTDKGSILLTGGTFRLTSLKDGIQAESSLTISGGDYTIYTGGVSPESTHADSSSGDASGKGIKAGGDIVLSGGTFTLYCADDAIHAKGSVTIRYCALQIVTGDDGIRAGGAVTIDSGKLSIEKCTDDMDFSAVFIPGGDGQ